MKENTMRIIVKVLFWLALIIVGIKLLFLVFHLTINYLVPTIILTIFGGAIISIVGTGFASLPRQMAKSIEPKKKKKKFKY